MDLEYNHDEDDDDNYYQILFVYLHTCFYRLRNIMVMIVDCIEDNPGNPKRKYCLFNRTVTHTSIEWGF